MGRAMLSALLKSSDISNDDIIVSTKSENSSEKIRNDFKVKTTLVI